MELITWGKTFLTAYRHLERLTQAIDKIVLNKALSSSNLTGTNFENSNVFATSGKIIELTNRKINLINIKMLVDLVISNLNQKDAKILILKYLENLSVVSVSESLRISGRTYFRRIASALNNFSTEMFKLGYTNDRLVKMLWNEPWIKDMYVRIHEQNELKSVENENRVYFKSISKLTDSFNHIDNLA